MKYMGSKARIAKQLLSIILEEVNNKGFTHWVEPFVGGCNMIKNVPDTMVRLGFDNNKYLIAMYQHLQQHGFDFPNTIDKPHYNNVRSYYNNNGSYLGVNGRTLVPFKDSYVGWVGFMASTNGRFFDGGYSGISKTKIGTERNYIDESIKGLKKEFDLIQDVNFQTKSFEELDFKDCIIYCDPPYKGTKTYNTSKNFDYELFYDWCRKQSIHNLVFVSEYTMPDDFIEVWSQEVKSSLSANGVIGGNKTSVEKLFKIG